MSVYKKLQKTINECDLDGYLELLHPNFIFLRHQFNKEVSKKRMDANYIRDVQIYG